MTDDQTPRSGSRWEPAPGVDPDHEETTRQPVAPPVPADAQGGSADATAAKPAGPVGSAEPASKRGWSSRMRSRGGLIGAALVLVLVSGFGGFAIGHATAGPDRFGLVRGDLHGGPGGFPGGDRDGDGPPGMHRDGFGTPPGGDDDDSTPPEEDDDGGADEQSGSTL
jgi:hypothetical protein